MKFQKKNSSKLLIMNRAWPLPIHRRACTSNAFGFQTLEFTWNPLAIYLKSALRIRSESADSAVNGAHTLRSERNLWNSFEFQVINKGHCVRVDNGPLVRLASTTLRLWPSKAPDKHELCQKAVWIKKNKSFPLEEAINFNLFRTSKTSIARFEKIVFEDYRSLKIN